MTNTSPAIEIKNFSYHYRPGAQTLVNLTLSVDLQEHTALLGLNGAGKSTLMRALVGLLRGNGDIRIFDQLVNRKNLADIRRRIGFLFQDPQVQLFCPTVLEDVAFGPLNLHNSKDRARRQAEEMLQAVGYTGDPFKSCHDLSMGEMRKVALAGVLACRPQILLLDEPDSFLDREGKKNLIQILQTLQDITLVLATHDLSFAGELCQQAINLQKGHVQYSGSFAGLPTDCH